MKPENSIPKKPWWVDAKWALDMQPYAIRQFYSRLWVGAKIIELDIARKNQLAQVIDIAGSDKMIKFTDGGLAFLAQRFRRYEELKYDDFTLRNTRPSGTPTEWGKLKLALQRNGFIAGFYAYGHANENEDGFIRMRILKLREFAEAILSGMIQLNRIGQNPNGSSDFLIIPFSSIPREFFILDYAEDKFQGKLF